MTFLSAMGVFAALLWSAPIVGFALVRMRRDRALWRVAADLSLATALDLLGVLALAFVMPVARAAWVARGLWAVGLLVHARRTRGAIARPSALGRSELGIVGVAALIGLGASLTLSRPYSIWDRLWHIPLVSSLGAQRLPFANVYDPAIPLNYHFTGDVLAAVVQSLSLGHIHAALALSLAHDALFVITGAALALVLLAFGPRGAVTSIAMTAGTLLVGPVTFFRKDTAEPVGGYSLFNYLTLSFRPHVVLAGLGIIGLWALIVGRLRAPGGALPAWRTAPQMLVIVAALAITDEASTALIGLALGALWVVRPEVIAPRRRHGILLLVSLGALFVGANLLFGASFGIGAPRLGMAIVAPRVPGYDHPSLLIATAAGRRILALDLFPVIAAIITGFLARLATRGRGEGILAFYLVLTAGSTALYLCLEVIGSSIESHRFVTAVLLLAPLVGVTLLGAPALRGRSRPATQSLAWLALAVTTAFAAASTLVWLVKIAPRQGEVHAGFFSSSNFYDIDCRATTGPREGGRPTPFYAEQPIWYLWAGCHPSFAPSARSVHWRLQVKAPLWGKDALRGLHTWLSPEESLRTVCRPGATTDAVCRYAQQQGRCTPGGSMVVVCALDAEDRRQLLLSKRN